MKLLALMLVFVPLVLPVAAQRLAATAPESLQSPPLARTETEKRVLATGGP